MGCSTQTNIYTISEKSSEMTLFDCRWVPCSARFVVAGTHTKGHGILTVYTITETEELKQSGMLLNILTRDIGGGIRTDKSLLKWNF